MNKIQLNEVPPSGGSLEIGNIKVFNPPLGVHCMFPLRGDP